MAANEAKVEFFKTRPEHKKQVGGATYVCKHLLKKLNNREPRIESEITTSEVPLNLRRYVSRAPSPFGLVCPSAEFVHPGVGGSIVGCFSRR